ncbi:MAG: HD domain-containing phosphohydrolase [Vicinamibacterales bacterium]
MAPTPGAPPRLLVKALGVSFGTVAVLLVLVFLGVRMSVRDQVVRMVTQNLEASQRLLGELEDRRLQDLGVQAGTLAESPTLKAALDTYQAEQFGAPSDGSSQLLVDTLQRELDKLAARVESDSVALLDLDTRVLAVSGRLGTLWSDARTAKRPPHDSADAAAILQAGGVLFRVIRVPLTLDDGATIGWLELGTALDTHYALRLDQASRLRIAVTSGDALVGTTLLPEQARDFQAALTTSEPPVDHVTLDGAAHAFREIARTGPVRIFALSSVDAAAATALGRINTVLAVLALGAVGLALLGSIWLARRLSQPIEELSQAMDRMAAARDLTTPLPLTGSSREVDLLARTFNHLMASVVDAEGRTEAAYAGAIRALAAALDARDPYTAGHSERVSVLSVAVGQALDLPEPELEVLRLGALLHDIGKIGIPDSVLRKPGPLTDEEFEAIMEHPVVGARILRSIPFLHRHIDIVELHHERPDGLGYPKGLRGDDIPLLARIVHVTDAYDAITSARAYRQGRSSEEAIRELWRCAGTEYHAEIVTALARALPKLGPITAPAPFEVRRLTPRAEARSA